MALTSVENAGQWLHTMPSSATQGNVDPLLFKTSIQRWLRTPIFEDEFTCSFCDGVMDIWGDHCLVCPGGGDRTKRHNLVRNATFHFCSSAGFNAEVETPGLLRPRPSEGALPEDGVRRDNPEARRPADVYIPRWRRGAPMALDFAVTSGLRSAASITATLQNADATIRDYEDLKNSYLDTRSACAGDGFSFTPMVAEAVGGGWGPSAVKVFIELAKTKSLMTGEPKNKILSHLYQSLGLIIHKENARAILRRSPRKRDKSSRQRLCSSPLPPRTRLRHHTF
jgi:hypothetical protein